MFVSSVVHFYDTKAGFRSDAGPVSMIDVGVGVQLRRFLARARDVRGNVCTRCVGVVVVGVNLYS